MAESLKPKRTPEAFLLDRVGDVRYRGRIDDRFAAIGTKRQVIGSHDLADAITAMLDHKAPAAPETEPVGCLFDGTREVDGSRAVTYARDIAPIVNANCVRCHRIDDIAPFALTGYKDVAKRAFQIAEATESGYMPPWKPAAGYGHFLDEQWLSAREKDLLAKWAGAGAPEGSESDLPAPPRFESSVGGRTPDVVLQLPDPFKIPAAGNDLYRVFVVPLNLPGDAYVAAIEFRPQAKSVVHHSLFYLDGKGKARELDAADPGPGYDRFGGPGFRPSGTLGGWAPGAAPLPFPEGIGRSVKKDWDLVVQMHYHPDGRERTDQSRVALYLQKDTDQEGRLHAADRIGQHRHRVRRRASQAINQHHAAGGPDADRRHPAHASAGPGDEGPRAHAGRQRGPADLDPGLGLQVAGPVPLRRADHA